MENSLAPQPQSPSYYRYTQVPNNAPGPSSILASTSRGNHYVPVPRAPLTIPTFYQHPT